MECNRPTLQDDGVKNCLYVPKDVLSVQIYVQSIDE